MFLGKLKYASPEQAGFLKEHEHLDPRSDLYSFGIVMYEMLAGRAPFQATNPHGYILKHVTEKPAPISELNPAVRVPPPLEAIIMKSLEKNRDQRYETAADFATALEGVRTSIAPDQKYGVGEKMVTLSGAQTLADLPKITGTSPMVTASGAQPTQQTFAGGTFPGGTIPGGTIPGGTMPGSPTGGTRSASDEATMMERQFSGSPKTIGSNEATVMERLNAANAAAPTAIEAKMTWGDATPQAEATVLERKIGAASPDAPSKKNTAMIAGIAAVVVIAILVGVFVMTRKPEPTPVVTTTTTAGTDVTSTAPRPPMSIAAGHGMLLLSASPWGELDRIVSKSDQTEVPLTSDNRSTPTRIQLKPGAYDITLSGPTGDMKTVEVNIIEGKPTEQHVPMSNVDFDALTQEVTKKQ
jgi:hypothetical protein